MFLKDGIADLYRLQGQRKAFAEWMRGQGEGGKN